MPQSKKTKAKSTTKPAAKKSAESTQASETVAANQTAASEGAEASHSKKAATAKAYKITKPTCLTHKQKAALARQLMICAGDLMDVPDAKFNDEDLVGIDPKLKGEQLAAWVSYLPGLYWDARLPQPSRARGRRKL
jgi:hypothetical protein